ncbi:Cupin 2 conserved barrel domain protein [Acidisarcina polymorpha]|uniref:Cupin 2 conserved barrel domain protein n=1 Tax=Acidisarcina polymorpha TaxID=2211140 RepID=A0A2Z5FWZ9_9BACT|nr:cupin domain-containing protein [Acidisarcina polymorpha]AXC11292.1 Cupin 2 conserved barrel domain protein [Acidisarcina polymorpha]
MSESPNAQSSQKSAVFDIHAIAKAFPDEARTMLIDTRLTDEPEASARVFRVYTRVPAHYHATCDEYLLVVSGRARFFLGEMPGFELGPGQLVFFKKGTVHGTSEILEEPFVVFSVDTPRRDPRDVIFVNPQDGTPEEFIESQMLY